MPVIKGEKWACTSCIKGHRVSGCNHNDRELHHIQPKGRPVKQCEHCRGARKSKSHHAKCDCGEKKDKDKLKDKGDAKGEHTTNISGDEVPNHAAVSENRCCCHSGAKCICGVNKDSLDLKLDTGKQTLHATRAKPKLTATQSESTLTVFANGHHRPCHRNNNAAHVSGAPYKIARPHTLHGSAAFANFTQGTSLAQPDAPAPRSMDTLSMSNTDWYSTYGPAQRSVDSLSITPLPGSLDCNGLPDSLFASQDATFGHGGISPSESHLSDTISSQQWPWTNSITPVNQNFGYSSLSTSPSQDCLPNLDNDWAIPSAGLNNSFWSPGDLPLDPSKLNDSLTQPISHSGESNKQSNPGLTTASSSHSEIGEPALFGDLEIKNPPSTVGETLFWEDNPVFRPATSAPSEVRVAPTSTPAYMEETQPAKSTNAMPVTMASTVSSVAPTSYSSIDFTETSAISMPNNIDDGVSNDPWLFDNNVCGGPPAFDLSYSNWL